MATKPFDCSIFMVYSAGGFPHDNGDIYLLITLSIVAIIHVWEKRVLTSFCVQINGIVKSKAIISCVTMRSFCVLAVKLWFYQHSSISETVRNRCERLVIMGEWMNEDMDESVFYRNYIHFIPVS